MPRSSVLTRTALVLAAVVASAAVGAGCRQDMHDAPRYDPLERSEFFVDGQASRPLVANTVSRFSSLAMRHSIFGPDALKASKLSQTGARSPSGGKP